MDHLSGHRALFRAGAPVFWLIAAGVIALRLPNTLEWTDAATQRPETLFAPRRALFVGVLLFLTLLASMTSHPGGFIYQNF